MISENFNNHPTGPKIKWPPVALPDALIPEGNYRVLCESAEFRFSRISGRPYILVICKLLDPPHKDRKVYYSYSYHVEDVLPRNEDECKTFIPIIAKAYIRIRDIDRGRRFNEIRRLEF